MAIDNIALKYLDKHIGSLNGKTVLTLGRLHNVSREETESGFAEELFLNRGAWSIQSLDAFGLERPTFKIDLNEPIPESFHECYDLIWDGGTIEHVWDTCAALRNVAKMLKPGGIFVTQQLLNIIGHGLYVISPEALTLWAMRDGLAEMRLHAYHLRIGWLREIKISKSARMEFFSPLPAAFFFQARRKGVAMCDTPYPMYQAEHCTAGWWRFWFRLSNIIFRGYE